MPDNLRVVPWEQFNTYNREIMEKVESLDTTSANENDVLTYTGDSGIAGKTSRSVPETFDSDIGKVLMAAEGTEDYEWASIKGIPSFDNAQQGDILAITYPVDSTGYEPGGVSSPIFEKSSYNIGKILTYTANSGIQGVENSALPPTNSVDNNTVLTYNNGEIEGKSPFPYTGYVDNHPKVLTYAPGEGFYGDTELPSTDNAINGDVLIYNGENLEGTTPRSGLPDTNNASDGYVLTYHNGDFEGLANNTLPEWKNSTEGGETLIVVSGASGDEAKTLSGEKTLGGVPLDYNFLEAIDEVLENKNEINGIVSVKSPAGVEGARLSFNCFDSSYSGKVLAIDENGQIYAANIQDLLNN